MALVVPCGSSTIFLSSLIPLTKRRTQFKPLISRHTWSSSKKDTSTSSSLRNLLLSGASNYSIMVSSSSSCFITNNVCMTFHTRRFALRYPTFSTDEVVSTTVPRVVDSAHFFSQGFFGREAKAVTFLTPSNFTDPVSWLEPWQSCPKLSSVAPYQVTSSRSSSIQSYC